MNIVSNLEILISNFQCETLVVWGIIQPFGWVYPTIGQIPTCYSPVRHESNSFDLHVLSTPPAFILSQDQTLQKKSIEFKLKIKLTRIYYTATLAQFSYNRIDTKVYAFLSLIKNLVSKRNKKIVRKPYR